MRFNHPVDGVSAAAPDADYLDFRAARYFILVLNPQAFVGCNLSVLLLSGVAHVWKSLASLLRPDSVVISDLPPP